MRVIAGRFKGRRLQVPRQGVRPSTDRVRERVFGVLGDLSSGGIVVDLFCGTGALGIEALSRGATSGHFVDRAATSLRSLKINLRPIRETGLEVKVYRRKAGSFISSHWPESPVRWTFLDPPYGDSAGLECLQALANLHGSGLGWVIFEGAESPDLKLSGLSRERVLEFGETCVTMYRGGLK
jgi:16S rRNA (guanine966-N2)-methyltransferase